MTKKKVKNKVDVAKEALTKGVEAVSELSAEERMEVYEGLFGKDGELFQKGIPLFDKGNHVICNAASIFTPFNRLDAEISDDGYIVFRKPKVFLSHNHKDKPFVRSLAKTLEANDIKAWVDEAELNLGDSLIKKLEEAIEAVDILVAVISQNSIGSAWVQKEIESAMTKEINSRKIKVIPIVIEQVELPGFLKSKVYGDFSNSRKRKVNTKKLIDSIRKHLDMA